MIQIAVDGPAGSGKSTVAREVAKRLGIVYLDTGAMYRAVTYQTLIEKRSVQNAHDLEIIVEALELEVAPGQIWANGKNVTEAIRQPEISRNVSYVAMDAYVRKCMVDLQRKIAGTQSVIMDGRDIGTHVLPNAKFKFFLTATAEERAKRRQIELEKAGYSVDYKTLVDEINERDRLDSEREVSPLKIADDAEIIDTTELTIDQVIDLILKKIAYTNE